MNTDKILDDQQAKLFLRNLGFAVDSNTVNKVIDVLSRKNPISLYELYKSGHRIDGSVRNPVCGKGTVDKVKKFYREGKLDPYIDYLNHKIIKLGTPKQPTEEESSEIIPLSFSLNLQMPEVNLRWDSKDDTLLVRIATIEVAAFGNIKATDYRGWLIINECSYPLYWDVTHAAAVTINPGYPMRLDVAITYPKVGEGCWIYEPQQIIDRKLQNYLPPKDYEVSILVKCSLGQTSGIFTLTSPESWDALNLQEIIKF